MEGTTERIVTPEDVAELEKWCGKNYTKEDEDLYFLLFKDFGRKD
jgi:hypothetical protein